MEARGAARRGRHRLRRGRAAAPRVPRAGLARRHHPDGSAPGRGAGRGRDGARDRADRPRAEGGVATTGRAAPRARDRRPRSPGGRRSSVDLRHPEAEPLARMLEATRAAGAEAGDRRGCEVAEAPVMADRADRVRPRPGRRGARGLRRGRRGAREPRQRSAPRRRRGGPRAAGGDGLRAVDRGDQPRPGGGHPGGRPRGRDRGVRCARRAPDRARQLVPAGTGELPPPQFLARCLQDINIRLTYPLGLWPPNSRLRKPGSGGPKGTFRSPGANRPSTWP